MADSLIGVTKTETDNRDRSCFHHPIRRRRRRGERKDKKVLAERELTDEMMVCQGKKLRGGGVI